MVLQSLKKSRGKDSENSKFLPRGQMQFPNGYHGKKQDNKIGKDIEYSASHTRSVSISAVTVRDQFVPYLLSWSTGEYIEQGAGGVKGQVSPDKRLSTHKQPHVAFSIWYENLEIL